MDQEDIETVAIVLFDGFDELDAIGPYEVFENASGLGGDLDVTLCTLDPRETVTASHGLRVEPEGVLDEVAPDLLVVPGGGWNAREEEGARREVQRGDLPERVEQAASEGTVVASVCTGGMILAAAGLLDGRPAVTHRSALGDLTDRGATVVDARVVDDGQFLTAGGVTSGLDLAVYLVERICGSEVADAVAAEMEFERSGRVHRTER